MIDLQQYRQLMEQGASPKRLYRAMKDDGVDPISCIKAIRQLLDISVREAKVIMIQVDTGQTLSAFQASLLPALSQVLLPEQRDRVIGIIQFLETLREKPGMYIGSDIGALQHYLNGLKKGCALCGVVQDTTEHDRNAVIQKVVTERGWSQSTKHVATMMRELGYPYHAIVNEVIAIPLRARDRCFLSGFSQRACGS
jgi:hypothetical protein